MKTKIYLALLFIVISCSPSSNQIEEKNDDYVIKTEVNGLIQELIDLTLNRNMDEVLKLYDNSEEFKLINQDGSVMTYKDLVELYKQIFSEVEEQKVIQSNTDIKPISKNLAFVSWYGEEMVKMKNQEVSNSKWLTTFLVNKRDGKWIIIYGNMSHF